MYTQGLVILHDTAAQHASLWTTKCTPLGSIYTTHLLVEVGYQERDQPEAGAHTHLSAH
jgi:hypothetical protein